MCTCIALRMFYILGAKKDSKKNSISSRDGPVKRTEQGRDENTRKLPYFRMMAEKKDIQGDSLLVFLFFLRSKVG